MIEKVILDYLIGQDMEGVGNHVYLEAPEYTPDRYVLVEKDGSGEDNGIRSALISIRSVTRIGVVEAALINEMVVNAMEHFAENSDSIYSCRLNSDYNNTRLETKEYRYQAVFNIYY